MSSTSQAYLLDHSAALLHQQMPDEALAIIKLVQRGQVSIYLVKNQHTQKPYALKAFPYDQGTAPLAYKNEERFSLLKHPHLISIIQAREECHIPSLKNVSYILMEYALYGDFYDLISKYHFKFDDKLIRTYFYQIVDALEYLHTNGFAHLDLKPQNLMLMEDFQLKIIDFDLSYKEGDVLIQGRGTKFFRAPELFKKEYQCKIPQAADIFSLAILIFILKAGGNYPLTEDYLMNGIDLYELLYQKNDEFWDFHCKDMGKSLNFFDNDFKELFNAMTKARPLERPTISQIKKFKWYTGDIYTNEELKSVMVKLLFSKD